MNDAMHFIEKVAISIGAASGMGLLFAENFVALGGKVVMCDINEDVLKEKAEAINEKGVGKAISAYTNRRVQNETLSEENK